MADADLSQAVGVDLDSDDVVTVETLNDEISNLIDDQTDLNHDYVVGDVSGCRDSNGHVHFDLVFEDASIHCVLFGFCRSRTTVEPEAEMQVAVRGELSFYEPQGSCSILVTDVGDMGESDYSQIYSENTQLLAEDGLLADERKQSLPELPRTIGLVTSADSDARVDAVTALHSRYPDVDIKVQHASVQGPDALQELMSGVATLDEDATVDVIVVTRGGGADKTLRVFNETPICRVVANTDTPTAVGIGHEDDRTLADEVADHRFMTPTHAGEIVPERASLEREFEQLSTTLNTAYQTTVVNQLTAYGTSLDNAYQSTVTARLQELGASLDHAAERHIEAKLLSLESRLETAYQTLQQEIEHEEELEETVEEVLDEAETEAQAKIEATQRRYRLVIAGLVLLVLTLAALYLL
jgi:exodeoxyribonuclease VII large subunit